MAIIALGKTDLRQMKYLEQLELKNREIEEVKPSFLQNPYVITGMVAIALIGGIFIGAQF